MEVSLVVDRLQRRESRPRLELFTTLGHVDDIRDTHIAYRELLGVFLLAIFINKR